MKHVKDIVICISRSLVHKYKHTNSEIRFPDDFILRAHLLVADSNSQKSISLSIADSEIKSLADLILRTHIS